MFEHHEITIKKLINRFRADDSFLALIIMGSVARGTARENSDVDIVLVATEEEFQRRKSKNELHYCATDDCDYAGGYVEGIIVDLEFLRAAAERGNEPTRVQLQDTRIAFSRIAGLEEILKSIPVYPLAEQPEKLKSFYAQMKAHRWRIADAEERADPYPDPYVLAMAAAKLALFGGRLILAYNKMLFPCEKMLMIELAKAPQKPELMLELMKALLKNPSSQTANVFYEVISAFNQWEDPEEGWVGRFRLDSEWHWREGKAPIEER
jgi:predicted nucleotidyltransferase